MGILHQMAATRLVERQAATTTAAATDDGYDEFGYYDDSTVSFWYTSTGHIVRWVVFLSLLILFTSYVVFGHVHAKKRIRKGLPPLAYHRWLIPRHELARVDPRYAYPPPQPAYNPNYYRPGYHQQYDPSYNMQNNMPPPPPMYDPNAPRPPVYDGPQGATKMAPSQEYEAPPGPPPPPAGGPPPPAAAAPAARNDTGSSNPFSRG